MIPSRPSDKVFKISGDFVDVYIIKRFSLDNNLVLLDK